MPDREFVAQNPEIGMHILYKRGTSMWVLRVDKMDSSETMWHYQWIRDVSTIEECEDEEWSDGSWCDVDQWGYWFKRRNNKEVRILNRKKPTWEV